MDVVSVGDRVALVYRFKHPDLPKVGEEGVVTEVMTMKPKTKKDREWFMYRIEWQDTKVEGKDQLLKLLLMPGSFNLLPQGQATKA